MRSGSKRWLAAAATIALGGCQLVFGLDAVDPDNPPIPDGCHGPFAAAQVPLQLDFETPTPAFFDPSLTADPDELWFTATDSSQDIYLTRRAGPDAPYVEPVRASFTTSDREYDAALTLDGRLVFFLSDRDSGDRLYQAARPDLASDFETVTQPILDAGVGSLELSADGLTIYFSEGGILHSATRAARDQAFETPVELGLTGTFPTVTADELEILFQDETSDPTKIRRAVRPDKGSAFGPPEEVFGTVALSGIDPEVSADGTRLIFGPDGGGGFFELTRSCP